MSNGLEVVRQDYFNSMEEVQFTFAQGRAYINAFGLKQYPEDDYVQLLIDRDKKTMIVKPCREKVKDSFKWCSNGKKRMPKKMKCEVLYYLVFQMMGWELESRYRITGIRQKEPEDVMQFNLEDAIQFVTEEDPERKGQYIRKKFFPKNWEPSFGMKAQEHCDGAELVIHGKNETFEIKLPINTANIDRRRTEEKPDGTESKEAQ